jgi:polyhydroxybutyrate depolymerase
MQSGVRILVWVAATVALCTAPLVDAACPPDPRALCRLGGKNSLRIVDTAPDSGDRLTWKWGKGTAAGPVDFGTPTTSTSYALCAYDVSGLVAEFEIPPGGTCGTAACWRADGKGVSFADSDGAQGGVRALKLQAAKQASVSLSAKGDLVPLPTLPLVGPLTLQLLRSDSDICFESIFTSDTITRNDASQLRARVALTAATPLPALGSTGCGTPLAGYTAGASTADGLVHGGLSRTFRVFLPSGYDPAVATPVVFLLHGGFGSGAQVEASANLTPVAEANGFIAVSPDGVLSPGNIRTWNGGGCCGYAQAAAIDDVGFAAAMLDHLESVLCVDRRRVYATGMSNGGIMSHRLACDLAPRIRAVAPVAGTMMASTCSPTRPVPVLSIHGTADLNVPYGGGTGCGAAGVAFTSVSQTVTGWLSRNACGPASVPGFSQGDGACLRKGKCPGAADVVQCDIPNGGHQWPGGDPPLIAGLPGCPFGYQSQTFSASEAVWDFFRQHPPR